MKFPLLKIENFLAITSAEIELADRGLIAIQGRNNADSSANSNGAGKSSIADALCWCWFGTTARGASGDEVINNTVGKGCRVQSTIIDGALTYTATRHRKHKTGKNRFTLTMHDGLTETDLTKGTDKLTQIEANKIIGSSLEVFAGSIYAGQEKMPDLPAYTDKQLKMLVEEAAGVTVLEEAYKSAREALSGAENARMHAETLEQSLRDKVQNLGDTIKLHEIASADWDSSRKAEVQSITADIQGIVGQITTMDTELKALDAPSVQAAIEQIDAKIAGVSTEAAKLSELELKVGAAQSEVRSVETSISGEAGAIATLEDEIQKINLRVGKPCGECGRPMTTAEIADAKQALETRQKQREDWYASYVDDKSAAIAALNDAKNTRDNFANSMTNISAEQTERQKLADILVDHQSKVAQRNSLLAQARTKKEQLVDARTKKNPYLELIDNIRAQLDDAQKKYDEAIKSAAQRRVDVDTEKEVSRVFSPAGVRARILDEVTPFLNAQTSKYLSTLSDGNIAATWTTLVPASKKGEFKEKFSIEVVNSTGGGSFKTLSGGEKRKVRIATALALQDLVATRASKPIDLFIGDEIDDALDASGLERLMLILDEKAKERGSVFVISHNDLADSIRKTLTIEKLPTGETKITEVAA